MAFVSTEGRITGVNPQWSVAWGTDALLPFTGPSMSYRTVYRTQPAVRTVVDFLARNVASLGLHVFRRTSDTDRERLTSHQLAQLIDAPSPDLTTFRLFEATVADIAVFGNAFWLKHKAANGRRSIAPLPPDQIRVEGSDPFVPGRYVYTGTHGEVKFPAGEIVHFRDYSPGDRRLGTSRLETLRTILSDDRAAAEYREQFWKNHARIDGVLVRPKDAPRWSPEAKSRFGADWKARFTGSGPEAGGSPILEDGMDWKPSTFSAQESQYIEARLYNLDVTAALYGVAPTLVGDLRHATFSNIEAQHVQAYQDTLGPWLTEIEQEIELQLLSDFDDTKGIYVEFNLAEKLKGSFLEQSDAVSKAAGGPWMLVDEARAKFNLPALGGVDGTTLITPSNVVRGGGSQPAPTTPLPPKSIRPKSMQQVVSDFFDRRQQAIRTAKGAGLDYELDWARWGRELTEDLAAFAVTNGNGGPHE